MDKLREIPQIVTDDGFLFDDWLSKIVRDFFLITGKDNHIREYEIIQYRFGLNGRSSLTLDETGIIFDITRERIRQVEKRALQNLAILVNKGSNLQREVSLNQELYKKLQEYRNSLDQLGQIINEFALVRHTTEFFSEINVDKPLLRLLLTLYGYKSISLEIGVPEYRLAWAYENINTKRVEKAIHKVSEFLRDITIAKPFEEIKLSINKNLIGNSRFNDKELTQAIELSYDLEKLNDGTIQIRYERLRSITDKA
jgi:hypothetical protein